MAFFKKYKQPILITVILIICFFPTFLFAFYKNREFVDIGLLATSILSVIFVLPIYNMATNYAKMKKEKKD
mgnify:CR=1 FL=1